MRKNETAATAGRVIDAALYTELAALLSYPQADITQRARRCREMAGETYPAAAKALDEFAGYAAATGLDELRESYSYSFDLHPVCTLDVGYHVFGESYKRGRFLAGLKDALRRHGVDPGAELPDHLPNVLRLLAALEDGEERDHLVELVLSPALGRMLGSFSDEENQFRRLVDAVELIVREDYGLAEPARRAAEGLEDPFFGGTSASPQDGEQACTGCAQGGPQRWSHRPGPTRSGREALEIIREKMQRKPQ